MSISRKDLDELKPWIDKTVQKFLGFSEPSLVTAAVNCMACGYDKKKTRDKLASLLDESKASRLADKLFETLDDLKVKGKSKRRHRDDANDNYEAKKPKIYEQEVKVIPPPPPITPAPAAPVAGQLSAMQIKDMMANAQRMIEERKRALSQSHVQSQVLSAVAKVNEAMIALPQIPMPVLGAGAQLGAAQLLLDPKQRISDLQQQITLRLANRNMFSSNFQHSMMQPQDDMIDPSDQMGAKAGAPSEKPTPLILDAEGRTVDQSGKEITLTQRMPTLKANIRAKKREQFKMNQEKVQEDNIVENKYFDQRVAVKAAQRPKRSFRFHDKGKFEQLAQRLRTKAQLEKLQQEIAQAAKKTGITSATKLALITPKKELEEGEVPEVEWWDLVILRSETYESVAGKANPKGRHTFEGITNLIEHPTKMSHPMDTSRPDYLPVYLTKKERKKLRRQNRREAWKEKQEKIRLGLEPPPEPKVRMANLMRVLGMEAVQDPTKIEAHVRAQMAKRQKAHEEANAARKLTVDQRRDKKIRKIKEDTNLGVNVAVYRVNDLTNPAKKFKVETNANQLFMTGCVVLYRDCNVIVVEGGPKQQKKFKRLMMHRIKWSEEIIKKGEDKLANKCSLVWEGTTKSRNFGEMKFKVTPTESFAREHFKKVGVEHYWDLAYSRSILEAAEDP